jgi:hypothetical protein
VLDFLPWAYGVGLVAVFVSKRSQRLGDLAAGTLVVRLAAAGRGPLGPMPGAPGALTPTSARLSAAERALVIRFLARREELLPEARQALARQIAAPLRQRLGEADTAPDDEAWLAALVGQLP